MDSPLIRITERGPQSDYNPAGCTMQQMENTLPPAATSGENPSDNMFISVHTTPPTKRLKNLLNYSKCWLYFWPDFHILLGKNTYMRVSQAVSNTHSKPQSTSPAGRDSSTCTSVTHLSEEDFQALHLQGRLTLSKD